MAEKTKTLCEITDPNEVVTLPNGSKIRPARFISDGLGVKDVTAEYTGDKDRRPDWKDDREVA